MIRDDIAKIYLKQRYEKFYDNPIWEGEGKDVANAILNLPHPDLTCTIGEALERDAVWFNQAEGFYKHFYLNKAIKHKEFMIFELPDGQRIKVKKMRQEGKLLCALKT